MFTVHCWHLEMDRSSRVSFMKEDERMAPSRFHERVDLWYLLRFRDTVSYYRLYWGPYREPGLP